MHCMPSMLALMCFEPHQARARAHVPCTVPVVWCKSNFCAADCSLLSQEKCCRLTSFYCTFVVRAKRFDLAARAQKSRACLSCLAVAVRSFRKLLQVNCGGLEAGVLILHSIQRCLTQLYGVVFFRVAEQLRSPEEADFFACLIHCLTLLYVHPTQAPATAMYLLYGDVSFRMAEQLRHPEVADFFARLIQRVSPKSYPQAMAEVVVTRKFYENFSGDQVALVRKGGAGNTWSCTLGMERGCYNGRCSYYDLSPRGQVRFLARGFSNPGDHRGQTSNGLRWPFGPVALITPFK
eukprot:1160011-Pelagomonas_calceolata.AAC.2